MRSPRNFVLGTVMAAMLASLGACDPEGDRELGASPDARISIHAVQPGAPTREGLAYIEAVARVHAEADGTTDVDA
ncbi:MAG: hypothetical protein JNK45_12145, partial [Myxococcales bacterium]|nr:hypothetical protein [Myxococcales bacterium]